MGSTETNLICREAGGQDSRGNPPPTAAGATSLFPALTQAPHANNGRIYLLIRLNRCRSHLFTHLMKKTHGLQHPGSGHPIPQHPSTTPQTELPAEPPPFCALTPSGLLPSPLHRRAAAEPPREREMPAGAAGPQCGRPGSIAPQGCAQRPRLQCLLRTVPRSCSGLE